MKSTGSCHTYALSPHTHSLRHHQRSQSGTLVTGGGPALAHHHHPTSAAYLEFMLADAHSVGFGRCVMARLYHCAITRSSSTAFSTLCALPVLSR